MPRRAGRAPPRAAGRSLRAAASGAARGRGASSAGARWAAALRSPPGAPPPPAWWSQPAHVASRCSPVSTRRTPSPSAAISPPPPALPPRLGAVRPRASAGERRRLPSAPASVSHLPCAEAPRGRCGATAGAGVLAAQLGGAERFPPRRGAAPGEGAELLRCPALLPPPAPQGALHQQEWGRVPSQRARGVPVP
ncbi:nascent polypeptide-associated complex subunit alpha, muscle-specific form-like [Onychostruthus taczanowskii]|uniref:nascent polypeptide-associated complex subunit alpha, muscle-specific form-like n=1 Tax=Onychostruthus taczanowskii TaxID=356909 RepID=UPI001B8095E1|nr:nascent polypeptide-associated complex subunit alpha, muscle-specific form-like [Onychostruthus taczanowskii]